MLRMLLEPINFDPLQGKRTTDPTPEEISSRAAEIRATWSADDELRRRQTLSSASMAHEDERPLPTEARLIEGDEGPSYAAVNYRRTKAGS